MAGGARYLPVPEKRFCLECKKEMTVVHYQHVYCSPACRRKYRYKLGWRHERSAERGVDGARYGIAAEHQVCADLLLRGYEPFLPTSPYSTHDILAHADDGVLKIQVRKGQAHNDLRRVRTKLNADKVGWRGADLIAIVVFETGQIYYFKPAGAIYHIRFALDLRTNYKAYRKPRKDHHAVQGESE